MKTPLVVFLCLLLVAAPSLLGQEKKIEKEEMPPMVPPAPLNDDFTQWMVGEWEGWTESPMGKTKDWQKVEKGLDDQFVIIDYKGTMSSMTPEQVERAAAMMNMSKADAEKMMKNWTYKGHGMITLDPTSNEFVAYWFDSWRGMYRGTGKREGNKVTFIWEGPMGTSERTTEKVGADKMVETFKEKGPDGSTMEGRSEWTRKKM